jgi:hypothetical protein
MKTKTRIELEKFETKFEGFLTRTTLTYGTAIGIAQITVTDYGNISTGGFHFITFNVPPSKVSDKEYVDIAEIIRIEAVDFVEKLRDIL